MTSLKRHLSWNRYIFQQHFLFITQLKKVMVRFFFYRTFYQYGYLFNNCFNEIITFKIYIVIILLLLTETLMLANIKKRK